MDNEKKPPYSSAPFVNCPSCKILLKPLETQCPQCGLILAKWKDPQQRAAEARLASLAQESSQGIPVFLKVLAAALITAPLLLFSVPDIGVPALGAKLRYRLDPKRTFRHSGRTELTLTSAGAPLEKVAWEEVVSHEPLDSDSGGNTTLRKTVERVAVIPLSAGLPSLEKGDLAEWKMDWVISSRGNTVSTLASTAGQIKSNAQTMNSLNQLRAKQAFERSSGQPGRPAQDSSQTAEAAINEKFAATLTPQNLKHLDRAFFFQWPSDRVRPGYSWTQDVSINLAPQFCTIEMHGPVSFKISGFERSARGYEAVVEWDQTVSVTAFQQTVAGTYKGQARIDYSDGVLDSWNENLVAKFPSTGTLPVDVEMTSAIQRLRNRSGS